MIAIPHRITLGFLLVALACLWAPFSDAAPLLENVSVHAVKSGTAIDLRFSGPVSMKGVRPDYERNFVQFVFNGVGIKNAKMMPLEASGVEKLFVYQYAPGVARLRLIGKDGADLPRGRINLWNSRPETVRILVKGPTGAVAAAAAKKAGLLDRIASGQETAESQAKSATAVTRVIERERITETKAVDGAVATVRASADEEALLKDVMNDESKAEADQSLGTKNEPSRHFGRMIVSLLAVIAIFVGGAFAVRRYADKIDLKKLPFSKKERLINVVASHRLGRNQAISLVKVTGEYMVMGVTGENINLIAKLGRDLDVEKYLEDRYWGGAFEKHLKAMEKPAPAAAPAAESSEPQFAYDGVKDKAPAATRPRFTPAAPAPVSAFRASIKEKLSALKPLS